MPRSYRAFTPEFLLYLQKRGGPPKDKDIRSWFKAHYNGLKGEYLSDVRNGRYAPEKYVTGLIEMLIRDGETPGFAQSRLALDDYLRGRNFSTASDLGKLDQILSIVCTPVSEALPDPSQGDDTTVDYLASGAPRVLQFGLNYMLRHAVRGCRGDSDDICEAIRWMYVRAGQLVNEKEGALAHERAVELTADLIQRPESVYQESAKSWHAFNPWIVVRARQRRKMVGMTIVLPLKPDAYRDVLEGRRQSSAMTADDLCVPSRHLVVEACAEHPAMLLDSRTNPTRSLLMCLALQMSALMRYQPGQSSGSYRWLSFGGTPKSQSRLLSHGFRATGKQMAINGLDIFERVIDLDTGEGLAFLEGYLLGVGGRGCPRAPILD